jgi:hypothetical protein
MMRDGNKSRVKARVIDISTHGCRIECTSGVAEDSWIWLSISGLENQYCRVVWHCQEFVGLEFANPLSEPVFEGLLADHQELPETAINDLRKIRILRFSPSCRANAPRTRSSRASGSVRARKSVRPPLRRPLHRR